MAVDFLLVKETIHNSYLLYITIKQQNYIIYCQTFQKQHEYSILELSQTYFDTVKYFDSFDYSSIFFFTFLLMN